MANHLENSTANWSSWYQSLREGGSRATEKLWQMYFQRMVMVSRRKLLGSRRAVADEEDIALSAFKSFCLGFQQGKFQPDGNPENLWPLLVTLTLNKTFDHLRREQRLKRGGAGMKSKGDDDGRSRAPIEDARKVDIDADAYVNLISHEPTPEMQVAAEEAFEQLLQTLDATQDASLREILLLSIVGNSTQEVATELECTVRTVQRKLQTIRALWEQSIA